MLIDISTAPPPFRVSQKTATEELKKRMALRPAVGRLIDAASNNSGIENRCLVIPDGDLDAEYHFYSDNGEYIKPGTQSRMNEYEKWSKVLTANAVEKLITKNKFNPENIDRIIIISCTGFFAPGIDYYLIDKFGFPKNIKRTNIGFMGCAASLIGFNSVLEAINNAGESEQNTILISVELCSLHLQTEATRDNILANIIFADGCAAALFSKSNKFEQKLKLLNTSSYLFDNSSDFMGWKIGNSGFEMILSSELPKIILNKAVPQLKNILNSIGIPAEKIKHWALHPGGRAILDSLQKGLKISDQQMQPSREVLKNYGNMSSASILYVLKELMDKEQINKNEYCCAVAFGPGLTMEIAVLQGV